MAHIASPASDPRSLRRHYPHQVQGVSGFSPDSQPSGSPALSFSGENRTRANEVNRRHLALQCPDAASAIGSAATCS